MSVLFSEAEADAEVINRLIREIRRIKPMPLLQLKDGSVVRVERYEVVTPEELQATVDELSNKLAEVQSYITPVDQPATTVADPSAPADQNPVPAPDVPADSGVTIPVVSDPAVDPPATVTPETAPVEPPVLQ